MNLKEGYSVHLGTLLKIPADPITHQFNYSKEEFLSNWVEFSGDEANEIIKLCRHKKPDRSTGQKRKNKYIDDLTQEKFEANPFGICREVASMYFYGISSLNDSFISSEFSFGSVVFQLREIMNLIDATNSFYKNIQTLRNYDSFTDFFVKKVSLGKIEFIPREVN